MKTFKKLATACALVSGLAVAMSANAMGPFFSYMQGIQLNPVLAHAFENPGTGITVANMQFVVRSPANCVDNMQGRAQTCYVALDHLDKHHGYYLTVTPYVQPHNKKLMTQISAYPDYETVLLTYTKPYLAGTALNVVDIKKIDSL